MPPQRRWRGVPAEHLTHNWRSIGARDLGCHPFPGLAAINSQASDGRWNASITASATAAGPHVSAKNSAAVSTVPKAVATGKLSVAW
jgi:hypothetical protein